MILAEGTDSSQANSLFATLHGVSSTQAMASQALGKQLRHQNLVSWTQILSRSMLSQNLFKGNKPTFCSSFLAAGFLILGFL